MERDKGAIVGGAILIVIGIVIAAAQFVTIGAPLILGGLSAAFLAAWALMKQYGFLIPGCILGGLAIGIGLEQAGVFAGSSVVAGLAIGFLSIPLLDAVWSKAAPVRRGGWWPFIPGGILALVAVGGAFPDIMRAVQYLWPLALVAAGAFIIWQGIRKPSPK